LEKNVRWRKNPQTKMLSVIRRRIQCDVPDIARMNMIRSIRKNRQPAQRVHELTEKLVDQSILDAEWSELQALLTNSAEGRRAYIEPALLRADLYLLGKEFRQELRP
jgi:hypothetical protein